MPKVFYTEKDIEDLVRNGVFSLEVNDNVSLTDLAYERANRLGLKLVRGQADNPPAAPVRPYLSDLAGKPAGTPAAAPRPAPAPSTGPAATAPAPSSKTGETDLTQRIRSAVIARLGNQVDPALLDTIIRRVLDSTGVK
jgi:hypothetical protein